MASLSVAVAVPAGLRCCGEAGGIDGGDAGLRNGVESFGVERWRFSPSKSVANGTKVVMKKTAARGWTLRVYSFS